MTHKPPAYLPEQHWSYPPAYKPSSLNAEAHGASSYRGVGAVPATASQAQPIWQGEAPQKRGKQILIFSLAGLGTLIVVFFTMVEAGVSETLVGAFVALVPLAIVLAAVRWLDRWEPEPRLYLLLSFAWGAGVATASALFLNSVAFNWLDSRLDDRGLIELIGVGLVAPLGEEVLKGGALLALVLWRSRLFNSGVDLVVYAATIASGFAFTENILYFARGSGQGMLGTVFLARAVLSPFAHIVFTTATAFILALVLFSRRRQLLWAYPVGMILAAGLHGLWNVTALVSGADFPRFFLILHFPIFATTVGIALLLRRRERRHIITHLYQYASAGWFAEHEVKMLGALNQRRQARLWAKHYGVRAEQTMVEFQRLATTLALNRHRMRYSRKKDSLERMRAKESTLLTQITRLRSVFFTLVSTASP